MRRRLPSGLIRRWLPVLLLGALLGAGIATLVLREIPWTYQSSITLLIGPSGVTDNSTLASDQLGRTYVEAVGTHAILDPAASKAGVTAPYAEVQRKVNAKLILGTQLMRIDVQDSDPVRAQQLASSVAEVLMANTLGAQQSRFQASEESLGRLLDAARANLDARATDLARLQAQPASPQRDADITRAQADITLLQAAYANAQRSYEDLRVTEARSTNTLTVLEPAFVPTAPIAPRRMQITALAALAGLLLAGGLGFLVNYLDDGVGSRKRVVTATGMAPLGLVPPIPGLVSEDALGKRSLAASHRLLVTNLQVANAGDLPRTVVVTSPHPGEGKSTTAANMAIVLAQAGQRVILLDADLYRPTQAKQFALPTREGLSNLLLHANAQASHFLQRTATPNLLVLTAGPLPADPSALLASRRLVDRLTELRDLADVVVIDTPPALREPDAALIASHADATLLVLDAGKSHGRPAAEAIERLHRAGARIAGVALNRVSPDRAEDYAPYEAAAPTGEPQDVVSSPRYLASGDTPSQGAAMSLFEAS